MAAEVKDGIDIRSFIFERELAEIYLLLDHLSACEAKSVPERIDDDPLFGTADEQKQKSWIQQICEIAWPPNPDGLPAQPLTNACVGKEAAMLIRAKDVLNNKAFPANGRTVAFTVMVAGEALAEEREARKSAKAQEAAAEPEVEAAGTSGLTQAAPSRATLAMRAFPDLVDRARRARFHVRALVIFLVVWMVLTCLLSWDVATGTSLLNRYNSLETEIATLNKQAPQPNASAVVAPTPTPTAVDTPDATASPTPAPSPSVSATPAPPVAGSAADRAGKTQLTKAIDQQDAAAINLRKWLDSGWWLRKPLIVLMGGGNWDLPRPKVDLKSADPADALAIADAKAQMEEARRTNLHVEWAAVALGVLTATILPIFYGVLGAGAAIVRILAAKMRDSVLAPRDVLLAYMRLVLGAVIGACIGLFVSPSGAKAEPGLVATAQLSASALCFIAGFGVEGVFQAFESIIQRIFNLEPARTPTPGTAQRPTP